MATERIIIPITAVDQFSNVMNAVRSNLKGVTATANNFASSISSQTVAAAKKTQGQLMAMSGNAITSVQDVFKASKQHTQKAANNFKMLEQRALKFGLSVLFGGMALQRLASTGLRAVFNTYQMAAGETSKLQKMTGELQAKFALFKFSIVDALTQSPLFEKMINFASRLLDKLNALGPDTKANIAVGLGALFVFGTALMIVGQISTLFAGTAELIAKGWKKIKDLWKTASQIDWSKTLEATKNLGTKLKDEVIGNMKWIKNNPLKTIGAAALVAGIISVGAWIFRLKDEMGGWGEFAKSTMRGVLRIWNSFAAVIEATRRQITDFFTGRGKSISWVDDFNQIWLRRDNAVTDLLGAPEKGWVQGRQSLGDIWNADLYNNTGGTGDTTVNQNTVMNVEINADGGITEENLDDITREMLARYDEKQKELIGSTGF